MARQSFWTDGLGSILLAVAAALAIRWILIEAYVIPSASMAPTLLVNDHIFVNKAAYGLRLPFTERWLWTWARPERGDVVVFKFPEDHNVYYIKRIVGVPGDRVFYENGNLYVNDQFIERRVPVEVARDARFLSGVDVSGDASASGSAPYSLWQEQLNGRPYSVLLRKPGMTAPHAFGPFLVPPGHYFVMGDHRDNSDDSRGWTSGSSPARGEVVFRRSEESSKQGVKIPVGTIVATGQAGRWRVRFQTTYEVELLPGQTQIAAPVQAAEVGEVGNVAAQTIEIIEGPLGATSLSVINLKPLSGGQDRRFVPQENLLGRASFIWLSCTRKISWAPYLCDPRYIRWARLFHKVHYPPLGQARE